jgi:transcriptional regulator with XRE-family HTH domain
MKRTGVLWCYVSRVECGHTVPKIETLEKWAKALDLELYQIFYQGKGEPVAPTVAERTTLHRREDKLLDFFRRMPERDQSLFLALARKAIKRQGEHE